MADPDHAVPALRAVDAHFWPWVAEQTLRWMHGRHIGVRDAVVLLPYAELLPLARDAFAAHRGWQPRIETTRTLAASLGPPAPHAAGSLRMDDAADRLAALAMLRRQSWASDWARRDPRSLEQAAVELARCAQRLARAAATLPPQLRASYWDQARSRLTPLSGPGALERVLARLALEWSAAGDAADTDRLFEHRPSAWVLVRCGGRDDLAERLCAGGNAPTLPIDTDPNPDAPFDSLTTLAPPQLLRCAGFEDEAQAAAAAVLQALQAGRHPVALIAQDRLIVRRVRALLERAPQLRLHDETGWKLSTTRAAARVMALLRATPATPTRDSIIDWLKAEQPPGASAGWLAELEAQWRNARVPSALAQQRWARCLQRLRSLQAPSVRTLPEWQRALNDALFIDRDAALAFAADPAGQQLLQTLHLDELDQGPASLAFANDLVIDLSSFTAWVDGVLESATFLPPRQGDPDVVITPLARAMLRPFGAVVMPGADERHLGASPHADALLGDALAGELGLPDVASLRLRETLGFVQLLRAPHVVLLRRAGDGGEPLHPSPLVERALRARVRAGAPVPVERDAQVPRSSVMRQPISRPAPALANRLPARLSASAVEALRECPYRFFARELLRLREPPELDAELPERDYGSWLHAVLHRFHSTRAGAQAQPVEQARLLTIGDELQCELGFDSAQMLPFRAAFESLAGHYVRWLHEREANGWGWRAGEAPLQLSLQARSARVALHGRLDRIDEAGSSVQLIDYKTGSTDELKRKVKAPLEDTQLAVYAALAEAAGLGTGETLHAMYLVLDERRKPEQIVHTHVADSAHALTRGLAQDLAEIDAGAGLAALGEGRVCEYCEMRGLCRRDHWTRPA